MKVGIIGDFHHGIKSDSSEFHDTQIKLTDWIVKQYSKLNIDSIIILGDWFHNRNEVNVKTLNVALRNLKTLSSLFNVFLIVGNHDCYYKNTIDINSLNIFDNIDNVNIISSPTKIKINDKNCLLVPWLIDQSKFIEELKQNKYDDVEFMFGHFEFVGGLAFQTYNKQGIDPNIVNKNTIVYSGHFHSVRKISKNINYLGSVLPLTWADAGESKYIWYLDEKMKLNQIENNISPKFIKIMLSDWITDPKKYLVEGNYLKVFIDKSLTELQIQQLSDFIKSKNPATLELIEQMFDVDTNVNIDITSISDPYSLIKEYVNTIEYEDSSIDKNKVNKLLSDIYMEAITQ